MTYADTAKSRHAEHILRITGIYFEMEAIICHCLSAAYEENVYSFYFQSYEKEGSIHFLQDERLVDPSYGSLSNEELTNCRRFFDNGTMAHCLFRFQPQNKLYLKFFIKDDYIFNKSDQFNLYVDVIFEDFDNADAFKISAYTQPMIDPEHNVSQALFWHALAR